ncbi:phage tail tape measure protein [Enterococcus asini]|uniref:Phage tail tape measure protein n=2 Tax=Enterococcus asini TaxID=57732 RepID=A0AAW8TWY1_9ENTE|nr:phage tail tape measure protein [Enterococcus asini]MDT2809196.1 phage tail tape measure protein [Enterococcus asini]
MVQNGRPLGNMVIKLGLDSSAFSDSLTGAARATKTAVKEMQAGFKVADAGGNKLTTLAAKQEGLTKVIQAQKNELKYLGEAYQKTYDEQGNATSKTAKAAQKYNEAQAKLASYEAQLRTTTAQMARMRVETEGLTGWLNKKGDQWIESGKKITKFGDGVQQVGSKLTKSLTVPLAAGTIAVSKAAIDWESAFAGVKKTNDEVVDSTGKVVYSYDDLEQGLRSLAKELPSSHQEIAAVAEAAGQLGIKTENVKSFTKTMIDMGESTNLSAETASTELARFANIVGMSQDKFSNLGSAIVDLGNNYATTEAEISAMALRLAGAGKQIGMSEGDILGFSAALSSVGVEAEAGGSAFSKVMVQMQLATEKGVGSFEELKEHAADQGVSWERLVIAVRNGGKELTGVAKEMGFTGSELKKMYKEADKSKTSLEQFADVAGMTGEQFAKMFKEDPSTAIMKFVEGLSKAEESGTSAIKVLDDMDIKEVRLRDSLLRAANASGIFGDAIETGNSAFKENTALAEEAGKRYETTESKLKMLKNEAVDAAIDLGGPLVDALRNGLQAAKPLVKGLGDLAKKFNDLDEEQQQNIIKWGALAMAAGPAIKIIGSGISIFGKAKTGVGLLSKGLVELTAKAAEKKALSGLATTVSGVGTAATTAAGVGGGATGIAGLASGLAAVAGPAVIAVGAIAAVGLAAYAGKKAYDEHQLAGAKWGTAVTKEQDKVIEKSLELREDATDHVQAYADGVKTAAKEVAKDNQKIVDSIQAVLDKEEKRKEKAAEGLQDEGMKKRAEAELKEQKEKNEKLVEDAKTTTTRINEIMANASNNNRELSTAERQFIQANYSRLSDYQLKAAGFTAKQRTAIETAYQKDLSNLSSGEYKKRYSAIQDSLAKEQKSFETQQKNLATIYGKNSKEYKDEMDILTSSHKKNTESLILGYARLFESQGYDLETNKAVWESYGWTVEEVQELVWQSTGKTAENLDMMAKGTKEADMAWNAMALDPKTGEVKTNMADTLLEMAKTDEGWSKLEFMVKNADLSTNAKEEIGIAMGEAGKWQRLSVEQKKLIVDGDEAKLRLYDSIEKLGMWDQYNADRKTLGVDNADAVWKLLDSEQKLNQWNVLPANEKQMLANNSDLAAKVFSSEEMWKTWGELPADIKKMFGDNTDVLGKLSSGEIALNSYQANNPALKKLLGDSTVTQNAARAAEEKLNLYSRNNPVKKNLQGNSASTQNAAKQGENALNSFKRNNPVAKNLKANDNASGPAKEASRAVDTFSQKKDHTVTLTSIVKNVTKWITEKVGGNATGTNYHPGGPMMVNDQKGPLYRELIVRPNGESFIPYGRDVILPDEPVGTKVYTASKTKRLIPHYANGVGVPENSSLVQNLRELSGGTHTETNAITIQADNSATEKKLDQLIKIMSRFGEDLKNLKLEANHRELARVVEDTQSRKQKVIKAVNGVRG